MDRVGAAPSRCHWLLTPVASPCPSCLRAPGSHRIQGVWYPQPVPCILVPHLVEPWWALVHPITWALIRSLSCGSDAWELSVQLIPGNLAKLRLRDWCGALGRIGETFPAQPGTSSGSLSKLWHLSGLSFLSSNTETLHREAPLFSSKVQMVTAPDSILARTKGLLSGGQRSWYPKPGAWFLPAQN